MPELEIRIGKPEDVDAIMDLALAACDENAIGKPNPPKMLQDIYAALCRVQGLVGIISEPGGAPEGAVLLRIGSMWYSDDLVIEEKAIFIRPEFRAAKGGRASQLCKFSKKISDELKLPLVIGVLSNHRTEGKIRMYEREFGKQNGAYWIYNGHTGH